MSQLTELKTIPIEGGVVTSKEIAVLPMGSFSRMQNCRNRHPGLEQRKGQIKHHTTETTSRTTKSLYQFSKGSRTERKLYRQLDDGALHLATDNAPTVTTGAFGAEKLAAATGSIPASYGNLKDMLLYSDGARQHQVYGGEQGKILKFYLYKKTAAIPTTFRILTTTIDYTKEVTDPDTSTVAILDSLGDLSAAYDCIYILTPVKANGLNWVVELPNGTASVAAVKYWNGAFTAVSGLSDGTDVAGDTLAQDGAMTWTDTTDEVERSINGDAGFLYQVSFSVTLDSEVEVSAVTYESSLQNIENIWDGTLLNAIEGVHEDDSTAQDYHYAGSSITLDDMAAADYCYFNFFAPVQAWLLDIGDTPNANTVTLDALEYWNGLTWTALANTNDSSSGLDKVGYVTYDRPTDEEMTIRSASQYLSYWYRFSVSGAVSASVDLSVRGIPYYNIAELGTKGKVNAVWKDRPLYTFDKFSQFIYVGAKGKPMTLNGNDYGILEAGDGRSNPVLGIVNFYNEIIVAQEERGTRGGCITLFEGYSPLTFGKLVLSTKLGILNSKCMTTVDGVLTSTATDEELKTLAFGISKYGVWATDGRTVSIISDDIQNYFDPAKTECIRAGYEDQHWMYYDIADNVIRIGLVSGGSATVPNIFPVFDLVRKTWSFDTLGQALSCAAEVEATSGDVAVLQVGGGASDGFVYQLNNSDDDVSTAIDFDVVVEINGQGQSLSLRRMMLRMKHQAAGDLLQRITVDGNTDFGETNLLDNGSFETDPNVEWTTNLCTIASVPGGQENNCLEITRVSSSQQWVSQQTSILTLGKLYEVALYTKSGSSGDEAFEYSVQSNNVPAVSGTTLSSWIKYTSTFNAITTSPNVNLVKKTTTAGNMLFDEVTVFDISNREVLAMQAETANDAYRRHLLRLLWRAHHISIKWRNNTISESVYLLDVGFELYGQEGRR